MSLIFSRKDAEERKNRLNTKYKISLDLEALMEVEHYTDWVSEAREDGYDEGLARAVAGIMNRLGCSAEEAMETANVPENRKKDVLDLVTKLQEN